jgi:F-type H+-transporting ATPase subunit delta
MAELVSKRYALALFEAGNELDKIEAFKDELTLLKDVFIREDRLIDILGHPRINKSEKKDLISKIFEDKISKEMLNFLYILVDKRRESHLLDIENRYEELYNEHKNIVKVVAKTAIPMEDGAKIKLENVLSEKLHKEIELTNEVDPSIMGGVLLKIADKLIDGSLKGQLENIGKAIVGAAN